MNGYDRIKTVLELKKPDRTPVMIHNFMMAAREAGFTMKAFRSRPENISKSFILAADKYDLDGILTDLDTSLLAGACGADLIEPEDEPALVKERTDVDIDALIDQLKQVDIFKNHRIQIYLEAVNTISSWCANEKFLRANADQGPFSLAFLLYGMNQFLMDILDENMKSKILELLDCCYEICFSFHCALHEAGAHCTSFGDSSAGSSLVSPFIYRKFAKQYEAKIAESLKEKDIKTICHICGYVDPILSEMAETGCAAFEIDNKTNIKLAKEKMQRKCAISGNIDPSDVMCFGTTQMVEEAARKLINTFKDGGLILGPGCALPANTPSENVQALIRAVANIIKA